MKRRDVIIVLAVAGLTVAVLIALLITGGADPITSFEDPEADVVLDEGEDQPKETVLADLTSGSVTRSGESFVFEASLAAEIPEKIEEGSLLFQWTLSNDGADTWIVSANLDVGPNASVTSADTTRSYSTFTESEHQHVEEENGVIRVESEHVDLELEGEIVRVTFTPPDDAGFPGSFGWTLETLLDGAAGDAESPLAKDRLPDEGEGQLEE